MVVHERVPNAIMHDHLMLDAEGFEMPAEAACMVPEGDVLAAKLRKGRTQTTEPLDGSGNGSIEGTGDGVGTIGCRHEGKASSHAEADDAKT